MVILIIMWLFDPLIMTQVRESRIQVSQPYIRWEQIPVLYILSFIILLSPQNRGDVFIRVCSRSINLIAHLELRIRKKLLEVICAISRLCSWFWDDFY